ncbi:MAG TPA: hemagglutinin protein [Bacteroidetes bacterium]|nr:hemagglutinin protein [Bacteroidota bacterium]
MKNYLALTALSLLVFSPGNFLFAGQHQPSNFNVPAAGKGIYLKIKVFLQGALIEGDEYATLMRDDLRKMGLLPENTPYSAPQKTPYKGQSNKARTIQKGVFKTNGPDAIVDWVFIELRDKNNPAKVTAARSALLQRDGDVVDMDGISDLFFEKTPKGKYYVAVKHRNHLGIMTAESIELGELPKPIDFTDPSFDVFGNNPRIVLGGTAAMYAGDLNGDGKCIFMGKDNDLSVVYSTIISDPENTLADPSFIKKGYRNTDLNLDGQTVYQGPNNERSLFFVHVYGNKQAPSNQVLTEQLPR